MEPGRKGLGEIFISGTEREPLPLVAPGLCHCSISSSSSGLSHLHNSILSTGRQPSAHLTSPHPTDNPELEVKVGLTGCLIINEIWSKRFRCSVGVSGFSWFYFKKWFLRVPGLESWSNQAWSLFVGCLHVSCLTSQSLVRDSLTFFWYGVRHFFLMCSLVDALTILLCNIMTHWLVTDHFSQTSNTHVRVEWSFKPPLDV